MYFDALLEGWGAHLNDQVMQDCGHLKEKVHTSMFWSPPQSTTGDNAVSSQSDGGQG